MTRKAKTKNATQQDRGFMGTGPDRKPVVRRTQTTIAVATVLDAFDAAGCGGRRWCVWKAIDRGGKHSKTPFGAGGKLAKANAPKTWLSRKQADELAGDRQYAGKGVFLGKLPSGDTLAGLDLDTCRDIETGQVEQWAEEIMARFGSYWEISPSGTGFKCFFLVGKKDRAHLLNLIPGKKGSKAGAKFAIPSPRAHPPAIDIYLGFRFFTVTEEWMTTSPKEVKRISRETVQWVIETAGPSFAGSEDVRHTDLLTLGKGVLGKLADRAANSPKLSALLCGDTLHLQGDKSRSTVDFALVGFCKDAGLSKEDARAALYAFPHGAGRARIDDGDERYIDRCWENSRTGGEIAADVSESKAEIEDRPGDLERVVTEAEAVLVDANVDIFQRGDMLVQPCLSSIPVKGDRVITALQLRPMTALGIVEILSRVARFTRMKNGLATTIDCPSSVAHALLARPRWSLRPLVGVITAPTMRPDGTILDRPGYDAATRLLYDPMGVMFPDIPANPTEADAKAAYKALMKPFSEFPFVDDNDRAVALSGVLTSLVSPSVCVSPMHGISGPVKGTGKSLLADLVAIIATGAPCPVIAQCTSRDEFEKRLVAMVLQGVPLFSIDNCTMPVHHDFLCQIITQDIVAPRVLGLSKAPQTPTSCMIFATGNNLRVASDMTRRTIYCAMDPECENPETRRFKREDVRGYVRKHRGDLVVAALILLRAYQCAGQPLKGTLDPLGSFQKWCDVVRDAIVWVGGGDAAATMERARESDPELESLVALMAAWEKSIGFTKIIVKDLITKAAASTSDADRLRAALLDVAGDGATINARKLGNYLSSMKDRIVGGRRIVKGTGRGKVAAWRLERVTQS